ncbi:MAG: ATP synthase F1 subunit delta [Coriobacteriales bacterium]|jgi:F-type H+-transporting ATPase subunit delta|nr:ATP synthase F1 subunit delta [Coriobacteriales bacterium]
MTTDRTLAKKASRIYAKALLDAASGSGGAFEVSGQLAAVSRGITGSIKLRETLTDHGIELSARQAIAHELFEGFDAAILSMLDVMLERDDIRLLPRVNEDYLDLVEQELGSVIIDVTTVVELDDELRSRIKDKYSAHFGKDVFLREHLDPSLVGGIVLSAHGRRIDASIASQLESVRAVLSTVSSGGDR